MNVLNRMMSYDKTKNENQEKCNCAECIGNAEISEKTEIIGNFEYADDFLIKVENYRMMCREYEILNMMNLEYWYKDVKTKNFIWKSLHVHGDKYIYHKSVYVKSKEKLLIECRNGHCFPKTPNDHLNGVGCSHCSGKRKLTTETFIEEANKIHGFGRYDYSKVKYVNNYTEVIIICPNHDVPYEFPQKPNDHLQGHGCKICGNIHCHEKQKLTLEEFIEKANEVHGIGRYDYSKVNYVNYSTTVNIICPNHDEPYEFPQTPNDHLDGHGCPLCGGTKKLTLNEFIERANNVHGFGRYNYSKVNYIDYSTEIIIICPIHGDFPQTPSDHLNGKGCSVCNKKSKGEIIIRRFLINNNIEFEREKRFSDCRDKKPLPFDFYLPKYNLCIEYDGIQHFNPSSFAYKQTTEKEKLENLQYIQKHDQMKNDYCKKNGIVLLRFNNLKTVEQELAEYFQNHGIIEQTIFDL